MRKLFLALVVVGLAGVASAQEDLTKHYSADLVTINQEHRSTSKLYVADNKTRTEVQQGPLRVVTISRPDEKIVYILLPEQKLFVEKPFLEEDGLLAYIADKNAERELVGTETVKEQTCDKYKVTMRGKVLSLWVNKNTRTPVQMASAGQKSRIEWTNVQVGPQPAELLKPPADYRKFISGVGVQPQ